MNVLYFYLILILFPYTAMWWKIFPKAGRKAWEAWIPLYNYCVASKIGGQPFWYGFLMIIPGIHLYMWAIFNVALHRRF
jgi:signal peptidase I